MSEVSKKVNSLQQGMFFFSVLLVTVALIACGEVSTDPVAVRTALEGNFSYLNISTDGVLGETTSAPGWSVGGQSVRYSIAPADGSSVLPKGIAIDSTTGLITIGVNPEVTKGSYTVTATGTDNYSGSVEATIYIAVEDSSTDAISGELGYEAIGGTFGEETPISPTVTGDLQDGTAMYSIIPALPGGIEIDVATGVITVGAYAEIQATKDYTVSMLVRGFVETVTATVSIEVRSNLVETLTYPGINTASGTEASSSPVWFGDGTSQTVEYSVAADGIGILPDGITIDASTGVVTVSIDAVAQAETKYTVTATGTGDYRGTRTADITVVVLAKGSPAMTGTLSYYSTFIRTPVGTAASAVATFNDKPDGAILKYTISPALPTGIVIEATTGIINVEDTAVAQAETTYTVSTTSPTTHTGVVTTTINITVYNPANNEDSPIFTSGGTATIAENIGVEQVIYTAVATDASSVTYSLGTAGDSGSFTINGDKVTLTANPDYETKNSYSFEVIATDATDNSAIQAVDLAITDVNDNTPVITNSTLTAIITDGATGVVYTATSEDVDTVGTISYTLGGTDSSAFTIATNGAVTIKSAADYDAQSSYSFTITANDGDNDSEAITVTITVADPGDIALETIILEEHETYNSLVLGQKAVNNRIILTPDASFFTPKGPILLGGEPSFTSTSSLNSDQTFSEISRIQNAGQKIVWYILPSHNGQVSVEIYLKVEEQDAGAKLIIRLGDDEHQVISVESNGLEPQPWNTVLNINSLGGTFYSDINEFNLELVSLMEGSEQIGNIQKIKLKGEALDNAYLLRTRWRPAAGHYSRFENSDIKNGGINIQTWIMEVKPDFSSPDPIGFYAPITTQFGYYGSTFNPSEINKEKFNSDVINFSLWSFRKNALKPPLFKHSHLLALGDPNQLFDGFNHEGTGVKPRGLNPWDGFELDTTVFALKLGNYTDYNQNYYQIFTAYYFSPDTQEWTLYSRGAMYVEDIEEQNKTLKLPGSFIEVPGPPPVERTGHINRTVKFRGYVQDNEEGNWHSIDTSFPSFLPINSPAPKEWLALNDGWFTLSIGGIIQSQYFENSTGQTTTITTTPIYMNENKLAKLSEDSFVEAKLNSITSSNGSLAIDFNINNIDEDSSVEFFYGNEDGLSLIYESHNVLSDEWDNKIDIGTFSPGNHVHNLSMESLEGDIGYGRILIKNSKGRYWSIDTKTWNIMDP